MKQRYKEIKEKYKKELSFIERRFLNQANYHSTANVVAKVGGEGWSDYPYCEFFISNCDRTISLDVDCDSMEDIDNSVFKMEQIIEAATSMKKALENIRPYIKEVKEEKERLKKEKELAQKKKE